jgi:hypothetical protein
MQPRYISVVISLCLLLALLSAYLPQELQPPALPTSNQSTGLAQSPCKDSHGPPSSSSSVEDPSKVTSATFTPTININRADYETALAKWQSQGVQEYQLAVKEVSLLGGSWTLHVTGDAVQVLRDPSLELSAPRPASEHEQAYSIKGLFSQVDEILTSGLCPRTGVWAFPMAYTVRFDEALGYPSYIERRGWEPDFWADEGRYSTAPAHSSFNITVESLNIVKSTPSSQPKDESNTNITRAQFDEARAKWQARGVQEYEIIAQLDAMGGGTWKLRVRIDDGKPRITRFRWMNEDGTEAPSPYELTPDSEYLTSLTVEGTFAEVESILSNPINRDEDYYMAYDISFDPMLGYVSELSAITLSRNGFIIRDGSYSQFVNSLRIIKSITPGMPKSGNPGP